MHAHHVRGQEVHRLAQHAGLGLDAAHPPADHADAVDHRGVAVGPDQRVGVVDGAVTIGLLVHAAGQILEVDLVHDADARGHDLEGVEGLHAPFHELVALTVARELQLHVQIQRRHVAIVVDHHRVVDHQVHRHQRLDALGILAQIGRNVAHGCQVGQQRHAGEVLQHHAGHDERNLVHPFGVGCPVGQLLDVRFRDLLAVTVAQHRLQHDANGNRQAVDVGEAPSQSWQRIEGCGLARRERVGLQGIEGIVCHLVILEYNVQTGDRARP